MAPAVGIGNVRVSNKVCGEGTSIVLKEPIYNIVLKEPDS